jgi:phage shock protein PspC (stress-responsive transcriptional regulator)
LALLPAVIELFVFVQRFGLDAALIRRLEVLRLGFDAALILYLEVMKLG